MLVIIGCGNLNRKDDGVGVIVAQQLQSYFRIHPNPDVQVYDAGTGGMEIMFQARHAKGLILIDACVSGSEPGTIFKLPGKKVMNRQPPSYSLHNFRWDHALDAGKQIFGDSFPDDIVVYLIEASDITFGLELTPPVSRAAEIVVGHVKEDVREREMVPIYEATRS